jgi:hypothetical protein
VDRENLSMLQHCAGESETFAAIDSGGENFLATLRKHSSWPDRVELRVGAQVVLLKNKDAEMGLVNGATGVVTAFKPLRAADRAPNTDLFKASRVPVVRFIRASRSSDADDDGFLEVPVGPEVQTVEQGGVQRAARVQLPLKLAWALSIHRSQGMTLPLVDVSLRGIFEPGQAYVALSRATDLAGLQVHDFDPRCIAAHPRVLEWNSSLPQGVAHTAAFDEASLPPHPSSAGSKRSMDEQKEDEAKEAVAEEDEEIQLTLGELRDLTQASSLAGGADNAALTAPVTAAARRQFKRPRTSRDPDAADTDAGVDSGADAADGSDSDEVVLVAEDDDVRVRPLSQRKHTRHRGSSQRADSAAASDDSNASTAAPAPEAGISAPSAPDRTKQPTRSVQDSVDDVLRGVSFGELFDD